MSLLEYWQLVEKPFEDLRSPRFFFESSDHREALDRMLYVVHDRNMGVGLLTGEIGSGKTMTKTVLERSLPQHEFEVASLDSEGLEFNDLLYHITKGIRFQQVAFEVTESQVEDRRDDKYYLLDTFKKHVQHLNEMENRHLAIIIDEAQQLSADALDSLKNLTNIGTDNMSYLTVLLIGQPELRETVKMLRQLDQRVSLRFHLNNLDLINTRNYINHRLRVAGCPREDVFTEKTTELLFRETGGVPREINRSCKLALEHGCANKLEEIDEDTIRLIVDDIQKHR